MTITFLGAAQTVTGSRFLITVGRTRVLVDCGLFQGYKALRLKNWEPFPIPAKDIDAILLTHAHLDHSGFIPRLQNEGFTGPIYCTSATKDLCRILLPDSGFLQEEEARFANQHGHSKHNPALPLYTKADAERACESFEVVPWSTRMRLKKETADETFEFEFHPAGHLFGAASVLVCTEGKRVLFSGDLGRGNDPITRLPNCSVTCDLLVVESTYGDRQHIENDTEGEIRKIILRTIERQGTLLIPSFAVGRAQLLLYYIHNLKSNGSIPDVPVYLNSPMALKANEIFCRHSDESKLSREEAIAICETARPVLSMEDSIQLQQNTNPKIIIAASGMATGGRVLHHLKNIAPDIKNAILFAGFQAGGTRGASLVAGATEIKIHGTYWPVRAEIIQIDSLSAHADGSEILEWIAKLQNVPADVFVVHGEPSAADELRRRIQERFHTRVNVPQFNDIFEI